MVYIRAKIHNPTWLKECNELGFTLQGQGTHPLDPLKKHLLSIAGIGVVLPDMEEDMDAIIKRGELWRGYRALIRKGEPCRCHANSASLFEANKKNLIICTGYGLSHDGLWRQHSWCLLKKDNRVVETTIKRILYYGFRLTPKESVYFCDCNY